MNTINKVTKLCMCCMEEHEVQIVEVNETNLFKNVKVNYIATYEYCSNANEYIQTEDMLTQNDIAMKNAYRKQMGLLLPSQIREIRSKYGISQSDLSLLLEWGQKTITRYESHQVQDKAHDSILRKIDSDPEWYLELLKNAKSALSNSAYNKYLEAAYRIYENKKDEYLKKTIQASYGKYENEEEFNGGKNLDLEKTVDIIRYFSNSQFIKSLYKVKLMKLLWYTDALSYKRYSCSMTGLIYKAMPMGAVPINHDLIIDLSGIHYEEIEFDEGTGYCFVSDNNNEYPNLTDNDKEILDIIIQELGKKNKSEIVDKMHNEIAYIETAPFDIIQYKYTKHLSID